MILRPRQKTFVENCIGALRRDKATLGVAPTGAGKTVMLSAVASDYNRALILQHRDELVSQNRNTFMRVNPSASVDIFTAERKRWAKNATFAMVQTLCRGSNLLTMPSDLDLLVIDEAHHSAANSYLQIIERYQDLNPNGHILGLTATPQRGDRKALLSVFPSVADVIQLSELVQAGFLVRPRCIVIDLGVEKQLKGVPKKANEFDMNEVERIMNHSVLNERIHREWKSTCGNRQTVVFCSTVAHAASMMSVFVAAGESCILVHGKMSEAERRHALSEYDKGKIQVVFNVAVLTEGWDCQPVSCVILARPCSGKSTMLQMIGRGLRKLDVSRYPGRSKSDCIIMDFGCSLRTHGNLEIEVNLAPKKKDEEAGSAPEKTCPDCGTKVPAAVSVCPVCDHEFANKDEEAKEVLEEFVMSEMDMIEASPFRWESLFEGLVLIANGMSAWASVIDFSGVYYAFGAQEGKPVRRIDYNTDKAMCLATADDFLRENGDTTMCRKSRSWLCLPPTPKQMEHLGGSSMFNMNRYRASCLLTWKWNEAKIKSRLGVK
jgi:DNA repair protein RadD